MFVPSTCGCYLLTLLYGPFLWKGFNWLKATATLRRQFTIQFSEIPVHLLQNYIEKKFFLEKICFLQNIHYILKKKVLYWIFFLLEKTVFTEKNINENVKIYISFQKYIFMQKIFVLQTKYTFFLNIYSFWKKIFFWS